jgi:hypothetical protein
MAEFRNCDIQGDSYFVDIGNTQVPGCLARYPLYTSGADQSVALIGFGSGAVLF